MLLWIRHAQSQANFAWWLLRFGENGRDRLKDLYNQAADGAHRVNGHTPHCLEAYRKLSDTLIDPFYPAADPVLMPVGHKQCEATGLELAKYLIDEGVEVSSAVVSPMTRTCQSALGVLKELEAQGIKVPEVKFDPDIRERNRGCKSDAGTPRSKLLGRIPAAQELLDQWNADAALIEDEIWWRENESDSDVDARIQLFRKRYGEEIADPRRVMLVFSHAGIIRRDLALPRYPDNMQAILVRPHGEPITIVNPAKPDDFHEIHIPERIEELLPPDAA